MWKHLPDESIFLRAFAEFALAGLAERARTALVKDTLEQVLVDHISRDGTAIETCRNLCGRLLRLFRIRPKGRSRRYRPNPGMVVREKTKCTSRS